MLEALAGFFLVGGSIVNQTGVQILEDRVPFRAGEVVDRGDRTLAVIRRKQAPRRKQGCRKIGDRSAD